MGVRERERRLRQRQRMLLFAGVEVVPHGRGKRATWLDRDWQPHLYLQLNTFLMVNQCDLGGCVSVITRR
jgi:hypothetical protein